MRGRARNVLAIAARHRGDLIASADKLLEGLPGAQKGAGFLFLAGRRRVDRSFIGH